MILIDLSNVLYANALKCFAQDKNTPIELYRHGVINTLRDFIKKCERHVGSKEVVIAIDNARGGYWRKNVFPHYKGQRNAAQEAASADYEKVHEFKNTLTKEIVESMPFRCISIDGVEADDIIGVLTKKLTSEGKRVAIVSTDKDYLQLQKFPGVVQWSPKKKEFIKCEDPRKQLLELIIRGDGGDGIPNVLSDDDTFMNKDKRQKSITAKLLNEVHGAFFDEWRSMFPEENLKRNELLIDLEQIPDDIQKAIIHKFETTERPKKSKMQFYFMEHNLRYLMERLGDF